MTKSELASIDTALDIQLPADYRHWAESLPPPGNESETWHWAFNDPEALIQTNLTLRRDGCYSHLWPDHLFCIAEADGNYYFLDLRNPASIYYTNHDNGPYYEDPDFSGCFYRSAESFYNSSRSPNGPA